MIKLLTLLFLFSLCAIAHPEDFSPYVKIISEDPKSIDYYSGSIIGETDKTFTVLTCWHGMDGMDKDNTKTTVNLMPLNSPNQFDIKPVSCYALFVKSEEQRDLALFKIAKLPNVKIKPLTISKNTAGAGEELVAFGYVPTSNKVIRNTVIIKDYTSWTDKGVSFLATYGRSELGPSGGPLVKNNEVYGTLSFRDTGRGCVAFCPHNEILEFLESK
jgi:hypothetical protein